MRIKIVSGTDRPFLQSQQNHQAYADRHGYDYVFDTQSYPNIPTVHFRKLVSVRAALDQSDWVFWLDDDAFFTDLSTPLQSFLSDVPDDVFLVICASPVNPQGGWTFLSSGQFFLRNDERSFAFIDLVMKTPPALAKAWWDPTRYGMFTGGDQDSIVFVLVTQDLLKDVKLVPYVEFNTRPYHYADRIDEHFLVHFPGVPDKRLAVIEFGARFGLDETLLPPSSGESISPTLQP